MPEHSENKPVRIRLRALRMALFAAAAIVACILLYLLYGYTNRPFDGLRDVVEAAPEAQAAGATVLDAERYFFDNKNALEDARLKRAASIYREQFASHSGALISILHEADGAPSAGYVGRNLYYKGLVGGWYIEVYVPPDG